MRLIKRDPASDVARSLSTLRMASAKSATVVLDASSSRSQHHAWSQSSSAHTDLQNPSTKPSA